MGKFTTGLSKSSHAKAQETVLCASLVSMILDRRGVEDASMKRRSMSTTFLDTLRRDAGGAKNRFSCPLFFDMKLSSENIVSDTSIEQWRNHAQSSMRLFQP